MIKIEIPGIPIPLQRHRSSLCGSKIRQYDSQKKNKAATQAIMLSKISPLHGPRLITYDSYEVHMTFNFYKPKQHSYLDAWGLGAEHNQKPDIDNLVKYVLDCGNRVLWTDDAKITTIQAKKRFWKKSSTEIYIMPKKNVEPSNLVKAFAKEFDLEDIENMCEACERIMYILNNSCETSKAEQAELLASAVQKIASGYAEKLMRLKKHGG